MLLHLLTSIATAHPARNIDILLNAPWDATPIHAEALAYFATPHNTQQQQHAYYAYAEALATPPAAADADAASIDELVRLASPLLEPLGRSVLRAHLAAGVLSPMVEMWRKLEATEAAERGVDASNTTAWLHVCGTGEYRAATGAPSSAFEDATRRAIAGAASVGCALPNSADERAHSASAPLGVDVVHRGSEVGGLRPPLVVLYAPLGADVFLAAHRLLADASARGQVTYVFRPLVRTATAYAERQPVQGYGVELAIKNMEYKAMDDDKASADEGAEGAEGADAGAGGADALSDDAEHGFFFQTLAARRPELKEDLSALREVLASSADSEDASNLKVWAMQDLGLQAAARVLRARKPLATLRELVQNFPLLARGLSRAAVDRDLEAEVERMHGVWGESYASATLNGRPLSLMRENDISDILASIRTQASAIDELASLGLDANATRSIISLPKPSAQLRVDTLADSDALVYLNDVEKDKKYARFRKPLAELLEPNMYGQMNFCRRNIFHLVFVVDPSTDVGMSALEYALGLMENGIPFRFGIVLAPPPLSATATSTKAASNEARLLALRARVASLGLSNVSEARLRELGEQSAAAAAVGEPSGTAVDVGATTVDEEAVAIGRLLTKLFLYIRSRAGGTTAMRFLSAANEVRSVGGGYFSAPTFDPLSVDHIERAYEFIASRSKKLDADVLDEMREGSHGEWEEAADAGGAFLKAKGLEATTQLVLNGFPVPLTETGMQEEVMSAIQDEWRTIKDLVSSGALADDSPNLLARLAELTPTFPRLNPGLLVEPESVDVLRLTPSAAMEGVAWVSAPAEDDGVTLVSAILAIDLTVTSDLLLAGHALKALDASPGSRLGFLLCPRRTTSDAAWHAQLATAWLSAASSTSALRGLSELVRSRIEGVDPSGGGDTVVVPAHSALCDEWGVSDTGATILVNGRLVRAADLPPLDWVDLKLLLEFERTQRAEGVAGVIGALEPPEGVKGGGSAAAWRADTIMYAAAAAARGVKSASAGGGGGSRRDAASASLLQGTACGAACVRLEGSGRAASLELTVAMDPLTKQAQRVATVLESLHDSLGLTVTLHLVPQLRISSFPLESFYRFVFDLNAHRAISGGGGGGTSDGHAIFSALRTPKVLTLHVDAPEAWLIECVEASYDMDNIRLGDLGERRTLFATYEIQSLLLTGSCEDLSSGGQPPNGLELRLGTRTSPHEADTLVMSNLGYFQLKALPGVWDLDLAPGTPSSDIYELVASPALLSTGHSMEAARRVQLRTDDSALVPVPTLRVAVSSYRGEYSLILVRKREGMESRSVLDSAATKEMGGSEGDVASEAAGGGGAFSSLSKWFGTGDEPSSSQRSGEVVHIFSLASGHLYERFLKIMMQSVLDGTRRRVKFWLLKNFLSPAFISYLPAMAAELDFEYGLVQYQWPSWLHKQTEKQRIIWGYKILFLDVMFPLSVRKIIYIDADQVVNADVGELWDMSLGKAAIGMTPFCTRDANPDTLGFRFFAQGYWKDHLAGKPYHISALFIVDLHKFRRRAYGDHYRILYDSLSKDPNSLANLDQDLPNFAQHQVAIKSLPEAWLWCETWCGNATKHKAKTIDLCNNPLTKEPKLNQATRVIGERWSAYDRRSREMEELGARGRENEAAARGQPTATAAAEGPSRDEL